MADNSDARAGNSPENNRTGVGAGPIPGEHTREFLNDPNARLSDFGPVMRAMREGFPMSDEFRELVIKCADTLMRSSNSRRQIKGATLAMHAMKHQVALIKMGNDALIAIEKERRQQSTAGKMPAEQADSDLPELKQPTPIALEAFIASSKPKLKVVKDEHGDGEHRRVG